MKPEAATLQPNVAVRLTPIQWLACAIAALGFAFDLYEMLMLPLIVRPAIEDLGKLGSGSYDFNLWVALLFFVPNAIGGIFGLLGGYLADRIGRRRLLLWSIILYSLSACAASFSTSLPALLIFRCATIAGISVEFVAAITWLAELFPEPETRESVLAYTQAFTVCGGLLVTGAYYLAVTYGDHLPQIQGSHEAWRYTLLSGLLPALPLIIARPFLPESPVWREKKSLGGLKRPSLTALFRPALRRTTLVATLLVACTYALPYGAIQHTPRMVPGLPDVRFFAPRHVEQIVSSVQFVQELGGLAGRVIFAVLIIRIAAQRARIYTIMLPALLAFFWLYFFAATHSLSSVKLGIFVATLLFNVLGSFWGNYLPRVYPTYLRSTGESFATNVGGRIIGVFAAFLTTQLSNVMPGHTVAARLAHAAGTVAVLACVIALFGTFWLREPEGNRLPD